MMTRQTIVTTLLELNEMIPIVDHDVLEYVQTLDDRKFTVLAHDLKDQYPLQSIKQMLAKSDRVGSRDIPRLLGDVKGLYSLIDQLIL